MKKLAVLLALCLLLTACRSTPVDTDTDAPTTTATTTTTSASASTTTTSAESTTTTETEKSAMNTTAKTTIATTRATTTKKPTTTTTTTKATTTTTKPTVVTDYSLLNGKTFYIFGDSYAAGHTLGKNNTWSALLADKYGMTYGNYGVNGNGFLKGYKDNPMYKRYTVIPAGADILMVVGGRNDYNLKSPLGNKLDTGTETFAGTVNTLITNLQEAHPDTLILFSTPWYVNEGLKEYSDMMLAICERRGIPCFNAADQSLSGVYMTDADWRATYCMSATDTDHLNAEGMKLVMPAFEKFIAEQYTIYLKG